VTRAALIKKRDHHRAVAAKHKPGTAAHSTATNAARRCERMIKAVDADGSPTNWINY
jgi:hypothetical protein